MHGYTVRRITCMLHLSIQIVSVLFNNFNVIRNINIMETCVNKLILIGLNVYIKFES